MNYRGQLKSSAIIIPPAAATATDDYMPDLLTLEIEEMKVISRM
jgi:hypothetical protein